MSNCTKPRSPERPNSAPERRQDLVTGEWIVLAGSRRFRPQEFGDTAAESPPTTSCAFCAGREDETTPTVASYPPGDADSPFDWQVRVVSNLYPAFVPLERASVGEPETLLTVEADPLISVGQHEVIIESPDHRRHLTELSQAEVRIVFRAYRDRMRSIHMDGEFRYATIFKNSGRDAGMSREHLHSQLVALPEIPPVVQRKLAGVERFAKQHGGCVYCHLIEQARRDATRCVIDSEHIFAFCPYASRVPYEVWVLPQRHQARFEQTSDAALDQAATVVREIVQRLETTRGRTAYNYVLHANPFDTCRQDHYHWHIEILPRTSRWAGLEWGTGVLINTLPPEVAAEQLRSAARA